LTYHKSGCLLKCHQCGYNEPAPLRCPTCGGEQIKYKGTGIQKAEEFLRAEFPTGRIIRMDQDTTRHKGAHMHILEKFIRHDADILLGTQMVAKGLNFPGVALVGVLQADIGMHFPDFRAAEKTFQLLAQVAGRAGRADNTGEVVIQTYHPGEAGIIAAGNHDFTGFYYQEIASRKELGYPPFGKLLRVIVQGEQDAAVRAIIANIANYCMPYCIGNGVTILGPSPAAFSRINNLFRYGMLFKAQSAKKLQHIAEHIRQQRAKTPSGIRVIIDVDPVMML
jgi:primosomal protein N' (replication factor Y)